MDSGVTRSLSPFGVVWPGGTHATCRMGCNQLASEPSAPATRGPAEVVVCWPITHWDRRKRHLAVLLRITLYAVELRPPVCFLTRRLGMHDPVAREEVMVRVFTWCSAQPSLRLEVRFRSYER
jgi:hypothetical protein